MEETKKYEPLRLKPCLRSYLWGGTRLRGEYHKTGEGVIAESWELSVRADGQTYIDSGKHCGESLADVLRADPVGMAGARCGIAPFPLLIKLIDAQKDLSVQVHPSDASACREKGVLVIKAKDKLRLLPALNIPMEQLQKAVAVIKACCAE